MSVLSLITKNSVERVGRVFEKVLESSLQVPYKAIILVDDSDNDKTREAVRRFADTHSKELVVERSRLYGWHRPTRATARQTAIDIFFEQFSDEWLMFLDDDCMLNEGWWNWVVQNGALEKPKVGIVWGINWDASPERRRFLEAMGIDYAQYLIDAFRRRGGTHDTLFRRTAIEGVKIPPELHVYEDAWLYYYVVCGGWETAVNPVGVMHFNPGEGAGFLDVFRRSVEAAVKYGIVEYDTIRDAARNPVLALLSLMRPVAGYPLMAAVHVKLHGPRGLVTAAKRQWAKVLARWYAFKAVRRAGGRIPNVCDVVRR